MIAFIVIGRNEGWKLTKCFQSVFDTILYNKLSDYEVIYVDSNSADNSIERAQKFDKIKILKITGQFNAAIARNIGASESKSDVFFFIDGDMEIAINFLPLVYNENEGLKYNFVSGQLLNYHYNYEGKFINKELYRKIIGDGKIEVTTGGLFLIKKKYWNDIGGMKTKYRRSQDIDFGLRLAKKGIKLYRKKEIAAIHHSINHKDKIRLWKMIFKGDQFYGRSVLYRDHLLNGNKFIFKIILRKEYTLILFIFSSIVFLFTSNFIAFIPHISVLFLRSINSYKSGQELSKYFPFYFLLRDILTFLGFILFYPRSKSIQYKSIVTFLTIFVNILF